MKTYDVLKLAVLNLTRRWTRTVLTMIGVIIGTAAIIMMVSVGLTQMKETEASISEIQLNRIEVYQRDGTSATKLNRMAVTAMAELEHVKTVIPMRRMTVYGEAGKYYAPYLQFIAVPAEVLGELFQPTKGTLINPESSTPQMLMGAGSAMEFIQSEEDYSYDYAGPAIDWMGQTVDVLLGGRHMLDDENTPTSRTYKFTVVGYDKDKDNYDIYISMETAERILRENAKLANAMNMDLNAYDYVYVYTESMEDVEDVLPMIQQYGFETYTNTEWIKEMKNQQKSQQTQLFLVGFISLLVSAVGIANTIMTGVLERKKEIGVMKVIGMPVKHISLLYLFEAAVLALAGGILGVLFAHLFAYLIQSGSGGNILGAYAASGTKLVMPFWLDAGAAAVALLIGVLAGFFPSRMVSKVHPMEAIRG